MSQNEPLKITLIGAGTIGLSFVALHFQQAVSQGAPSLELTIHDSRPDIEEYILNTLPAYTNAEITKKVYVTGGYDVTLDDVLGHARSNTLIVDNNLESAVSKASIIQEQGPENAAFKTALWPKVEQHCPPDALLWSSTSGISASTQSTDMRDRSRLIVAHPWNPPHVMPLIEVVPSPYTSPKVILRTMEFWKSMGKVPVLLQKEITGFVGNRLAFALLREAIHLVNEGVASVEDIDSVMENSLGPRWAVSGPFKSYQAGGGEGGIEAFFKNIGGTVQACWDDIGKVNTGEGWEKNIYYQTKEAYGVVDTKGRDAKIRKVLGAAQSSEELHWADIARRGSISCVMLVEIGTIGAAGWSSTPPFFLQIPSLQSHGFNGTPATSLSFSSRDLEIRPHPQNGCGSAPKRKPFSQVQAFRCLV